MGMDYWWDIIDRLRHPDTAHRAANFLATGLGRGDILESTNLGEALKHLPREELVVAVIEAYRDWTARHYCDQILWYFAPDEILEAYRTLENPEGSIKKGVRGALRQVDSPLARDV
jgi:hypothetical protein